MTLFFAVYPKIIPHKTILESKYIYLIYRQSMTIIYYNIKLIHKFFILYFNYSLKSYFFKLKTSESVTIIMTLKIG